MTAELDAPATKVERPGMSLGGHLLTLAEDVNQLYPELIAAGGLVNALRVALRDHGSTNAVFERPVSVGVVCVRVEGKRRRCQVYLVEQRRLFVFDLWAHDAILVGATAATVMDVAARVHTWLAEPCSAADVVAGLERVSVDDDGMVYDARDDVDQAWRRARESPHLAAFVREASEREKLRQLLPYVRRIPGPCLGFSRCTRYPFTRDIPSVWWSGSGRFKVVDVSSERELGRGDAARATDLIEAHLPPGCGPALSGTSESLGPLE